MGVTTSFSFNIKCEKISKILLKKIFDFLFKNGFDYNVSFLCQYQGNKNSLKLFKEKSLSKNSYENINERIDFLISQGGGAIELGWKNKNKTYEVLFHIFPTENEKGFIHLALSFRSSITYNENGELNNNHYLLLNKMEDLSKFVNVETKMKTTKIEIGKI